MNCNSNCFGGNCWWIIILLLLFCCCGNNGGCANAANNNCGAGAAVCAGAGLWLRHRPVQQQLRLRRLRLLTHQSGGGEGLPSPPLFFCIGTGLLPLPVI